MDRLSACTDKSYWDTFFAERETISIDDVLFKNLFERYLPKDPKKSVLEIGCGGGGFLAYFAKHHSFQCYGIDFSNSINKTRELFMHHHLPPPVLYQEDFFTWQTNKSFDVVCSFGFVEHFLEFTQVIQRHAALVAPGGKLIISIPNFRGLQFLFHVAVDPGMFKLQNLDSMKLSLFRKVLADLPFTIEYLSYYKCFDFWAVLKPNTYIQKRLAGYIKKSGKFWKRIFRYKPNRWVSPHIICIAQHVPI